MNQLELWNHSRQLSSQLLQAYENEISFSEIKTNTEPFPFSTETEFNAVMSGVASDSPEESIGELQKIIYERVKSLIGFNIDDTVDNSTVLNEWNDAQSASKDLLNWHATHTDESSTPDSYESLQSQYSLLPQSESVARKLINNMDVEQYSEKHSTLTRVLYDSQGDFEFEPDENDEYDDIPLEIAELLVQLFADRNHEKSYTEIKNEYPDITSFPSRDESMMVVMNTTADTRDERVEKIADWVFEWVNDEEYAEQLSHSRQPRMGMN